ncbi:DNA polymerase III subunit delta [Pseudarthrobacter sp. J75]|uniref:DNA polymerase III subunit delta n=1 Tax=unclassified Pseudarthrobacter TaxID=2647000 RepID=UPI002E820D25|nr:MULTISPECIES: DNA polymerase III subunit delta [unclassified Pseudarthrobacter]MEE2523344.1 DNA polymerase III subunit delta [Pseudarthrobacter sp. J47]MEE2529309.1 DNA polymerase III subunit delta [Pseudarthrobacter sp. J75]MEE2569190.1 DNA polymerase III subunit delta [Pseudarthrobacter sp. J64]
MEPAAVVLISGPEEYLGIRAMDSVRARVRAAAPDVEVTRINAAAYEAGALRMHVSPSLFGERKLIEVEAVEGMNDAFLADALAYLEHLEDDAVLVLRHAGGTRGKKLLDAVKAGGWPVVDCQPLKKDSDKATLVTLEFKAAGRRIEPAAVQALVSAVGANLSELAAACSQLIADATTAVDADMVDKYYGGRIEATAFKVADAAMAGNGPVALSTLRHALATGADPVPLVAALAAKLRTVAKVAGAQGSPAQIARDLGLQPWLVEQAQRDVRRWTPEGLVRSIQATAEADAQVKGLAKDPVYAVEHAVTVIATSVKQK